MEIKCPKCGFVMPDDSSFCGRCGCDLTKSFCTKCGKPLVPDSKFCMYCGTPVNEESKEIVSRELEVEEVKESKKVESAAEIEEVKESKKVESAAEIEEVKISQEQAAVPLRNIEEPSKTFESETATVPMAKVISENKNNMEEQESATKTEEKYFSEKETVSLEDVIGKNADYYMAEFRKIDAGEKTKFNWAAFFLVFAFCFYRKCGHLAKKFFLIPMILTLLTAPIYAIGMATFEFSLYTVASVVGTVGGIWMFVNAIRLGKNFNREYKLHLQQVLQSENQNKYGVSMKAGILAVVITTVVISIIYTVILTMGIFSIFTVASDELPMETEVIEETEYSDETTIYADNLSYYVGTWYGSNLKEQAELPETKVVGMQLTILPLDGKYYAYLATNTDVETYTFDQRSYEGDSLIPIFLTEEGKWIAYFDKYNEAGNYVDSGSLTFWKSATGELFGELYSATGEDIGQTKFVKDSKWLNGQYSMFEEENSYLSKYGETYSLYAIDCEVALREFVYGKWHDSTGIESESITLLPGQIYVFSITKNAADGITKIQYSTMRDPMKMHTIRIPEEYGVIYIDGRYYSGGYFDLIDEKAGFKVSTYLLPTDSCYITYSDLAPFSKEEVALIRNEIYARYGCTFNNVTYRTYFESQSWYYPVEGRNASNFNTSMLNDYERKNIDTIVAYEKQMGWR